MVLEGTAMAISIVIRALAGPRRSGGLYAKADHLFASAFETSEVRDLALRPSDARVAPRIFCRSPNCQSAAQGDL